MGSFFLKKTEGRLILERVKKPSRTVLNSVVWGPLVNNGVWPTCEQSKSVHVDPTCEQYIWATVNSAVWAPRGARTHGVAPILGPLVYVLNAF